MGASFWREYDRDRLDISAGLLHSYELIVSDSKNTIRLHDNARCECPNMRHELYRV